MADELRTKEKCDDKTSDLHGRKHKILHHFDLLRKSQLTRNDRSEKKKQCQGDDDKKYFFSKKFFTGVSRYDSHCCSQTGKTTTEKCYKLTALY